MAALAVPLAALAQDWEDDMTSSVQNYQLGEGWSYQSGPFTGEITALVQPHLEWKYGPSEVFSDATVRTRLRRARVRFAGDHRDSRFYYRLTLDLSDPQNSMTPSELCSFSRLSATDSPRSTASPSGSAVTPRVRVKCK